jgi:hypothetical protein
MEVEVLDDKLLRISDILEQIDLLNQQIAFHQKNGGDAFSINQYEHLRKRFLDELKELFLKFHLQVDFSLEKT